MNGLPRTETSDWTDWFEKDDKFMALLTMILTPHFPDTTIKVIVKDLQQMGVTDPISLLKLK